MLAKVPRSVGSGGGKGLWRATFMARAGGHRNSVIQTRFFDRRPLSGYIVEYHVSSIGWNGRCFQEGAKFKKTQYISWIVILFIYSNLDRKSTRLTSSH